jgi:hypothetical protein
LIKESNDQGDEIGRIFAVWAIVYFGQFFFNRTISAKFWTIFLYSFCPKLGWATIWVSFSQTHLVTLAATNLL